MKAKYLILFIFLSTKLYPQNAIKFGLNTLYFDSSMISLIQSPKLFKSFAQQYHIEFLRYPAGTESRTYFWDKPQLISQAQLLYANYLQTEMENKTEKAKHSERMSEKENTKVDEASYGNFLRFCKKNNITPIIVLSIWFYHDNSKAYMINPKKDVDKANWNIILQNIQKQVQYSHSIFDGTIYWEIGNEDNHIFSAQNYAEFVTKYSSVIKKEHGSDKVLITISNPTSKKVEANWNTDLFRYLVNNKVINYIDYVAPHYYRGFNGEGSDKQLATANDIAARFRLVNIYSEAQTFDKLLSNYPNIHIFYTEFGLFKKNTNPNYNSQLEGLLTLYYLMTFNASPRVDGVIRHGFTQVGSGLFYNTNTLKVLKYNFTPQDDKTNDFFKYITPKARAIQIFFENNPVKANKLVTANGYSYTISKTSNGILINLINYTADAIPININNLTGFVVSKTMNAVNFKFSDLQSKQWNSERTISPISSSVKVPAYSYSVITIPK